MKTKFIFCGVVSGYIGNDNTMTPEEAAQTVSEHLHKCNACAVVLPAVSVYHTNWGCPEGGEPVGAFKLEENNETLAIAERLRKSLNQSTLTVSMMQNGIPTVGFVAKAAGYLREIAKIWQIKASELFVEKNVYVSCGMVDNGDGTITISAEANPIFTSSFSQWKEVAEELLNAVNAELQEFSGIGFNYLSNNK